MIKLDVLQAKSELLEGIWEETGNEQAVRIASRWFNKWIKELHVTHTFSREILGRYGKDSTGLIEHTHIRMYQEVADAIFKNKSGVMETESNTDHEGRQNPFEREDHLTVYVLAK